MFTADEILKMTEPEELFPDSLDAIEREYQVLAKRWHPDRNKNSQESNDVMTKINNFRDKCVALVKEGNYKKPGFLQLSGKNGKFFEIKYKLSHSFELGTMYIGDSIILYLIDEIHNKLCNNAETIIRGFSYPNDKMKEEISRYLPKILKTFETNEHQVGIVIEKTPDLFLLRDLLNYFDGKIPPRHVAWILSSLYNLECYFNFSGLSHNAISIDSYFVSPQYHSGALLGGWWYAVPLGHKMLGVPEDIFSIIPPSIKNDKLGNIKTDLEAIRLIGRELLGDRNGTNLKESKDIPLPLINWVRGTSSNDGFKEYKEWNKTLLDSYGERLFIPMEIDNKQFYEKIKTIK